MKAATKKTPNLLPCGRPVSHCVYLPEKARWTFAQKGQWRRTPCRGRPSHSRSASAHSSAGSVKEARRGRRERERERGEECGIDCTHHSRRGEELHWQRGHWHYTLVIVLHKICLEALVTLREGGKGHIHLPGQRSKAIWSYVPPIRI